MAIRCGTCAWADHEQFYPLSVKQSERLSYYARYFSLVEVDSSYYRIPEPHSVRQWVKQTPDDFVFDIKAYRTLTQHDRGEASRDDLTRDFAAFTEAVQVLYDAGKLGIVLFQFPPWYVCTEENVQYVESVMHRSAPFTVGIEFRHRSWFTGSQRQHTVDWLTRLQAVNVVCDEPQAGMGTIPFVPEVTHAGKKVMFRLHGRNADTWYQKGLKSSQQRFDYKYTVDELREFLPVVHAWAEQAGDVHILMNNNQADYAVSNALDWLKILGLPVKQRAQVSVGNQLTLFDMDNT